MHGGGHACIGPRVRGLRMQAGSTHPTGMLTCYIPRLERDNFPSDAYSDYLERKIATH